jgi:two-component system sensor histidine kinase BaeS
VQHCATAITDRYRAAGVDLSVDGDPATPPVRVDPDRIAEAITNLLDNALRHTPTGGRVTVTVTADTSTADADLDRGWARVEVRDTGDGFDPTDADRLFERFHRGVHDGGSAPGTDSGTDRDIAGGSGIGLTIARAMVQAHGGHLRARSLGRGRGATFAITLPAADGR